MYGRTFDSLKTQVLIRKLERQLLLDVLPASNARQAMREKIEMYDLILQRCDGFSAQPEPTKTTKDRRGKGHVTEKIASV
jgi:hypothetical protein